MGTLKGLGITQRMHEAGQPRDEATQGRRGLIMGHLWGPALSKDLIPGQWSDMIRCELENDPLDSLTRGAGGQPGVWQESQPAWLGLGPEAAEATGTRRGTQQASGGKQGLPLFLGHVLVSERGSSQASPWSSCGPQFPHL